MSRGLGRTQRLVYETLCAHQGKGLTVIELTEAVHPEMEITRSRLSAVRRAIKRLVSERGVKRIRDGCGRQRGWNHVYRLPVPAGLEELEAKRVADEICQLMQGLSTK